MFKNILTAINVYYENFIIVKGVVQLFSYLAGIAITTYIGWKIYIKKQLNETIKNDISCFNLIFYSINNNLSYAITFLEKANINLQELENSIHTLETIRDLLDCFHNKKEFNSPILLSDKDKKSYLKEKIINEQKNLIIKNSTIKTIGCLHCNNYEKEALFMTRHGDLSFQAIYTYLISEYPKTNQVIELINQCIDSFTNGQKKYTQELFSCDFNDANQYTIIINNAIQKLLYLKNMYEQLRDSAEYIIFYTDVAFNKLLKFNHTFAKKYKKIAKTIGEDIEPIKINRQYDLETMNYYNENKTHYQQLNDNK